MERPTERTADAKDGDEIRRTLVRKFCGTENAFERKDEKNVGTHNGENESRGVEVGVGGGRGLTWAPIY